jgi:oligoendopeptidase F
MQLVKSKRNFLPENYSITNWESLKPYFDKLINTEVKSADQLWQWCLDRSELESLLEEDMAWRYIKMTCNTLDKSLSESFNYFVSEIQPPIAPYTNDFNNFVLQSAYLSAIHNQGFDIYVKLLKKEAEIYRSENIPLFTEIDQKAQEFGAISGAMTVEIDGKELTMPKASDILLENDRKKRDEVYFLMQNRRLSEKDKLNQLYSQLISLRHQVAQNAGFENYRDYMFVSMGRFDYSPADCIRFHQSIEQEVMPIINQLAENRKNAMKLDDLRPWDMSINYHADTPLKPFENGQELLEKTIQCFRQIDPFMGDCIQTMKEIKHLDLESRKGKAPGGYNYPLDEIGVPFIFMNATNTLRDLVTMVHEGGHAVHSFLAKDLPLSVYKHPTSEVAELASMSMELISMEHWEVFFNNEDELKRAKREHLESIMATLPWVACIDKFQHWIYLNPNHTEAERETYWFECFTAFSNQYTNWSGIEHFKGIAWQKQLHLFEVPFYYIEYAIAQLGAIAVWKNYKLNPEATIEAYKNALKLGYTKPIKEIYQAAGIEFNFSGSYIRELMQFVKLEIEKL